MESASSLWGAVGYMSVLLLSLMYQCDLVAPTRRISVTTHSVSGCQRYEGQDMTEWTPLETIRNVVRNYE